MLNYGISKFAILCSSGSHRRMYAKTMIGICETDTAPLVFGKLQNLCSVRLSQMGVGIKRPKAYQSIQSSLIEFG